MIKTIAFTKDLDLKQMFMRSQFAYDDVNASVAAILEDVRLNGDAAVIACNKKFDHADTPVLQVSSQEIDEAYARVSDELKAILTEAKNNITAYHSKQVRNNFLLTEKEGVVLGQVIRPIEKVGIYVPGGTAAYPSTVLMNAIPAKLAGVQELVLVSPPNAEGKIGDIILAAAKIAGVDKVFKVGGAQAIAALSYGTESIPRVYKIVGPGNIYVAMAKKMVYGEVSIDMIAGPSEILVIADATADPVNLAADLLSQAEHDRLASAILVTNSQTIAEETAKEIERQLSLLPRESIARASIDNYGRIVLTDTLDTAIAVANEIAPEHLEVCTENPFDYLSKIKNAGSIFLGKYAPEALGDYFAGPNHTLPTSGTAKFSSPLSVDDFIKKSSVTYYTREALEKVKDKIELFAKTEGLDAHARSVVIRFRD